MIRSRAILICGLLSGPAHAGVGAGVQVSPMPSAWSEPLPEAPSTNQSWWEAIGDPNLTALIEEGLRANLDLAGVRDRIRQAEAAKQNAMSALLPNISFDAGINGQPASLRAAQFTGTVNEDDAGLFFYQGSAAFNGSLQIDLSGRNVLGVQAGSADVLATADDADGLAANLANQIAAAYFDLAATSQRLALVDRQSETSRQLIEFVEGRLDRGESTALDVLQQRQQLAGTDAQRPLLRAAEAATKAQLAVLLGRVPSEFDLTPPTALPALPAIPNATPRDLLRGRPDLRAADGRLTSSWRRRLAAERAWVPSLGVSANAGWNFTNNAGSFGFDAGGGLDAAFLQLEDIVTQFDPTFEGFDLGQDDPPDEGPSFQSWFGWGIGASISVPIFQGGRSIANLKQTRAAERSAARALEQAKLNALSQVESARARDREQRAHVEALRTQAQAARDSYDTALVRYTEGIGDYLTLLTALVSTQSAEFAMIQAERDALSARISLHVATGGAWTHDLAGGSR